MSIQFKPIIAILLFLFAINISYGQSNKHEIKVNPLYAALGIIDIHYERITLSKLSVGASFDVNLRWEGFLTSFVVFGRVYASVEAENFYFEIHHAIHLDGSCSKNQVVNFIGPAIGYKLLLKKDFTLEIMGGAGFRYLDINCREIGNTFFPRLGIMIGKRF